MTTSYRVTDSAGRVIGIYPQGELASVKALVDANRGAQVKPVISIDNPCHAHPAYEADYCPACGTGH